MKQNQSATTVSSTRKKVTLKQALTNAKALLSTTANIVLAYSSGEWLFAAGNRDAQFLGELSTKIGLDGNEDICVAAPIIEFYDTVKGQSRHLSYWLDTDSMEIHLCTDNELKKPKGVDRDSFFGYGRVKNLCPTPESKLHNSKYGVGVKLISATKTKHKALANHITTAQTVLAPVSGITFSQLDYSLFVEWLKKASELHMQGGTLYMGSKRYYSCDKNFHSSKSIPTRFKNAAPVATVKYDRVTKKFVSDKPLFDREFSMSCKSAEAIKKVFSGEFTIYYTFSSNMLLLYSNGLYLAVPIGQYADYATNLQDEGLIPSLSRQALFSTDWFAEMVEDVGRVAKGDNDLVTLILSGEMFILRAKGEKSWGEICTMPFEFTDVIDSCIDDDFLVKLKMSDLKEIVKRYKGEVVNIEIEQRVNELGEKQYGIKLLDDYRIKKDKDEKVSFEFWGDVAVGIVDKRTGQPLIADSAMSSLVGTSI